MIVSKNMIHDRKTRMEVYAGSYIVGTDGRNGSRRLVRCRCCSTVYLIQSYLSKCQDTLFEDWYEAKNQRQADYRNRTYTGIQLERILAPAFTLQKERKNERPKTT